MQETKKHRDALDEYYAMGAGRTLRSLADRQKIAIRTAQIWSKEFNWQLRVTQRDVKNSDKIEAKTDNAIVNTKADYRRDIRLALQPVKAAINKAIVKNEETGQLEVRISIAKPTDLESVIRSFVSLAKLDLLLMGEADSSQEIILKLPKEWKEEL